MSKLPKFTLSHNEKKDRWDLTDDKTDRVIKTFQVKADATKGGVLEKAVGKDGGSVKIQKVNGSTKNSERTQARRIRNPLGVRSKQAIDLKGFSAEAA